MIFEHSATLTPDHMQQHLPIDIHVPQGTTRLVIDFDYAPHRTNGYNNLLTLTVYDPQGCRGEGHKHDPHQQVILSASESTPGYFAGAIATGLWQIIINTQMVQEPVTYRITVQFDQTPLAALAGGGESSAAAPAGTTAPRGPGWYRGDLHSHTWHSDAAWDVKDLVAYARAQHLDFLTLTDHNTVSPLPELHRYAGDDLLTIGGMEFTTYWGHALAVGIRDRIDWRLAPDRRMSDVVAEVEAVGGLFIIAHPHSAGNPECTGCDWQYADLMPGIARFVEVWNWSWEDPTQKNEKGLRLWYDWLNQGFKMLATAGSDIHGYAEYAIHIGRNVVYAEDLSVPAILAAFRAGRSYLSQGPHLELTGSRPGHDAPPARIGDTLSLPAVLAAHWRNAPDGSKLRWIVDGKVHSTIACGEVGEATLTPEDGRWCVLELRDAQGDLQAVTNPIYLSR